MSLRKSFFALTYDRMIARSENAGLRTLRQDQLADVRGRVLEIGGGTGANLPFYGPAVESLTVTEPDPPMLRRLERHVSEQGGPVTVVRAAAEELPFEDASFDTVVSTLVLCGVDDQSRALREIRRVLRPGGTLVFIEHVRSDDARFARFQDRMNGINRFTVGCECNRETLGAIRGAGFEVESVEQDTLDKAPKFVRPLIVGVARAS